MRTRERLSLVLLYLTLFILCAFMFRLPQPARERPIRPPPIEATFAEILVGMTEQELVALMAPYQEVKHRAFGVAPLDGRAHHDSGNCLA